MLILSVEIINNGFACIIRAPIQNKSDAIKWKEEFERLSLTTFRVSGCFQEDSPKIVFKVSNILLYNYIIYIHILISLIGWYLIFLLFITEKISLPT